MFDCRIDALADILRFPLPPSCAQWPFAFRMASSEKFAIQADSGREHPTCPAALRIHPGSTPKCLVRPNALSAVGQARQRAEDGRSTLLSLQYLFTAASYAALPAAT